MSSVHEPVLYILNTFVFSIAISSMISMQTRWYSHIVIDIGVYTMSQSVYSEVNYEFLRILTLNCRNTDIIVQEVDTNTRQSDIYQIFVAGPLNLYFKFQMRCFVIATNLFF